MKITLPTDFSEVTVTQYKQIWRVYEKETEPYEAVRRAIETLCNLECGALQQAHWGSIEEAAEKIGWLMQEPDVLTLKMPLKQTIKHRGIKYGYIPDWSRLTVGEFADIETYTQQGLFDNLEKILSVLYRPICKEKGDSYEIEKYDVSKRRQEAMLQLPMDVAIGAMVFFCNIEKALATTSQPSLKRKQKKQKKQKRFTAAGDGME